jgi:heme-degrading monooxygenase HmoA
VFRVHEDDRSYRLLVRWDSVDSHCEGFQKSPAFVQWRAWIGPFFSGMPRVVHGLPLAFDTGAST